LSNWSGSIIASSNTGSDSSAEMTSRRRSGAVGSSSACTGWSAASLAW
jgi:hypothetical protein